MLRTLRLRNYRCFRDHTVTFQPSTVVVGKNNAGKSTIVEALHLIAAVVNRSAATFVTPPGTLDLGRFQRCIAPKITHLNLNLETAFHRYGDPPAILTATFTEGATVTAYVHKDGVHATINGPKGSVTSTAGFCALQIPHVHILPQVAPLQSEETSLTDRHVEENFYTRLSSRHFRNQIQRNPSNFTEFKTLAERTWHGLRIDRVHDDGTNLTLLVTDGDFAAEVGWMGHGLQMWLQTMWFIAKTPPGSTVVLDEPDVYMHPDLQRKFYRLVRTRFAQAIIATHSVEIMAEADPSDILIINNRRTRSQYANTEPGVQILVDRLGGIHNVHLARLWNARRVILVEGDDVGFLKTFHSIQYPDAETPLDAIPSLPIGGWDGWEHAIGSNMALKNAVGDRITTYCIFDSDYHTAQEKEERYAQAKERGINLHIWERKEIENYLLNPNVIVRSIKARTTKTPPTPADVQALLDQACEDEKDTVQDAMATSILRRDRPLGLTGANKIAREELKRRWEHERLHIVSGKTLVSRVSAWAQQQHGASIGAMALARGFRASEIPQELQTVVTSIEEGAAFPTKSALTAP
jgi:energy-coupling factor transporter ATP-binding protein EcfA2